MTARLSKNPSRRNTCRYCGMETGSGGNHARELECVEALTAEVVKARRLLAAHGPGTSQGGLTVGIAKAHRPAG